MRRHTKWLLTGGLGVALIGVPISAFAAEAPMANLQAGRSPLFLANIDDDAHACQAKARTIAAAAVDREAANEQRFITAKDALQKEPDQAKAEREYLALRRSHRLEQNLADREMAACNDAADTVVNGPADELDLARLQVTGWVDAPASATGRLTATGNVHLFVKRAQWELAGSLSAAELKSGVQLGIEGRDVVRDRAVWDGTSVVTLTVTADGRTTSKTVRMHEAPVLTQPNTGRLQRVLTAIPDDSDDSGKAWRAATAAVLPKKVALSKLDTSGDEWMQDLFEPAYASMPGPDGRPHGMRVLINSLNDMHRVASRITFTQLAGPDVAAVHIELVPAEGVLDDNTFDSMGNLETVPPTAGHRAGQIVVGGGNRDGSIGPAPEMLGFLRAQQTQGVIQVDTSWLSIGHVDEFVQFVAVPGSRLGWRAVVADPTAGIDLLRSVQAGGHGTQLLHGGLPKLEWPYDERIDQRTVDQFLADPQFVDTNRIAAQKIAGNIRVLEQKTGLTDADVVRVPMLYTAKTIDYAMAQSAIDGMKPGPARDKAIADLAAMRQAGAEIPNPINGLIAGDGRYIAPKPFGTVVGGTDLFAKATSAAFRSIGYQVTFVDDLISTHVSEGEIHCATNTFRDVPGVPS